MHPKDPRILATVVFSIALTAGIGMGVYAQTQPSPSWPLYYAGSLDADGQPAEGRYTLVVTVYDKAEDGDELCKREEETEVRAGRFRIDLSSCAAKMKVAPEAYVGVTYTDPSGNVKNISKRAQVSAVPWALEAQHAVSADVASAGGALASQVVPAGAVMAFDLEACPVGWTELASARGRAIVGVNPTAGAGLSARAKGATFGSESVVLATTNLPPHAHSGTTGSGNPMHYRAVSGLGTATSNNHQAGYASGAWEARTDAEWTMSAHTHSFTTDNGPGTAQPVSVTQPSLALLYCKKI